LIKTIFISPHSDDIALSIGGTIAVNLFEQPFEIVTIFSKSVATCFRDNNLASVSKIREMEDTKYAATIGAKINLLNFPDSSIRGYKKGTLDIPEDFDEMSDPIFFEVYNSLSNILSVHPEADIVCPLGIGNHVDHILVLNVCTRLCVENNRRITYYEDLPYVALIKLKDVQQRVNTLSNKYKLEIKPRKVDITNKMNHKISNLRFYSSQISCTNFISHVKIHSVRMGFDSEYLLDIIWSYGVLRYPFKKLCIRRNIRLYEQIWPSTKK
jgi:LmbE family N-acetylglucosaminyl deacetylase